MIRRWVLALLVAVIANWFFLCDAFGPVSWLFNLVLWENSSTSICGLLKKEVRPQSASGI